MTRDRDDATSREAPGLVLLHAPSREELPAAWVITNEALVIGRSPPAQGLRLNDRAVSSLHARIYRQGDVWTIKDLGSRNGTLVNGRLVRDAAALSDLDEIRVGEAIFKFVTTNAAEYPRFGVAQAEDSEIIGGYQMQVVRRQVEAIAKTDLSVIVRGETGSGKELIARAVHSASGRRGPLVALNCAAIPQNLIESELFGWKRGAFTGADRDKTGLVRAADGGTLLLDEIGDMPRESQAKLLRVLETHEVLPLGATSTEPINVRFVCATHRDLDALVSEGQFRGDLFARLNGATIRVPPLRQRKEDLFALLRHFLRRAASSAKVPAITTSFMAGVCHYDWPYNVRELEATARRALVLAKDDVLTEAELTDAIRERMRGYGTTPLSSPASALDAEAPASESRGAAPAPSADELRAILHRHKGNVAAVARELGRDRTQIHRWMRYAGIDPQTFRE